MAGMVFKLGWTNPLTGVFQDHPTLGSVLDLNDGVTFALAPDGLALEAPPRTLVTAGNIRSQGERGTRGIYRHNRRLTARLLLGPMASAADLIANVRALAQWLSAPPALPVALQYQPVGASLPVYADVVGAAHNIPSEESQWLRLQLEEIEIVFLVRPGLRGDRVTLSNLAANPGFESPAGGGTADLMPVVFNDSLANANAYTTAFGSAPSVAGSVLTIPGGTLLQFGSPAWSAIAAWQVRFQLPSSGGFNPQFLLHYVDYGDTLGVDITANALRVIHTVGGTLHVQASAVIAPSAGTWYWLTITQFPSPGGDPAYIMATLNADSSGTMGAAVGSVSAAAYDAATATVGQSAIYANNTTSMAIGGAYSNVHTVALFGPGGWSFSSRNGTTGTCSAAWEGTRAELGMSGTATAGTQTYAGGPVVSFGALRIDMAPAGTIGTYAYNYLGGSPSGSQAMPVPAAGNVLAASCSVRSSGLGASCTTDLFLYEYDASGGLLRTTRVARVTGNQANWMQLTGTLTTGANCAYANVLVLVTDTSGSNGGTLWLDNMQVYNQTTTGQTSMPYCELRFPNSPSQLVVSGLQGDLPAPAYAAIGTFLSPLSPLAPGGLVTFALARAGRLNPNALLVGASHGYYGTAFSPQATAALDAASYGGYYAQATVTSAGWNPRAFSPHPADAVGTYHLFERHLTKQATPNLANVQVRVMAQQLGDPWYGNPTGTDQLGTYNGAWSTPITSSNTWTLVDAGQVAIPPLNAGALTDLTQTYVTPRPQWTDATGGGASEQANWQMLLPVDGSLLVGVLNNPSNAPFSVTGQWLWSYFDGLAVAGGGAAGWTYSLEGTPLANPAHAGGGPGTQSSGAINVNSGADPYLTLDPAQQLAGNGGVNALIAYIADSAGTVLPLHLELQYAPLYLWAR